MKITKLSAILPLCALVLCGLASCSIFESKFNDINKRLDKLENTAVATVNNQILNITKSIPGIEQSIEELEAYVSLLKKENISSFSVSITNLETYIADLKIQLTEIKNHTQNLILQEYTYGETWVDITMKTLNLYQSVQTQLSLVKIEVSNVKNIINELSLTVNQQITEFNISLTALINQTEISMMSWVNERFTAYYTIAEINAHIHNLFVENNVEINNSINALTVIVNDLDVYVASIYENVIQQAILYCEGHISELLVQKIEEASINLNVSIENINTQITDIENRILIINNSINTITEQVTAINVSIEQMTVLHEQINQYITVLQQNGDTYNTQIILLQEIQADLTLKIQNLNIYVENIVNNFNTTINDTKNWVSLTFATLEQYNIINTTIVNIQAIINVIQVNIQSINQTIIDIDANITNIQNNISITITNLDNSTREWVNKKLTEYLTIREADEKFAWIGAAIKDLQAYIKDTDEEALLSRLQNLEVQMKNLYSDMDATVRKAVEDAIKNHDGDISNELASLSKEISSLKFAVDYINSSIAALKSEIEQIKSDVDKIKNDLYNSIQSITVIPTYSDGSVGVDSCTCAIEFEIFPIITSQNVINETFRKSLSFDVLNVQTKSGSTANPLKNLSIIKVEMNGDFLRVYVNFADLDHDFFSGRQAKMGRLKFTNGSMYKSSGYFTLYPRTSTKTSAYIQSTFMNSVSGSYNVSSIVFKYNDHSTSTGTEIQTADSPVKIYANISGNQMTISTPANQIMAPVKCDMFCKMPQLKYIEFGEGFNTSLVESMHDMFYYCENLESLDLSGFDFSHVSDTREMLLCTYRLSYLDFGDNDLSPTQFDRMCQDLAKSINKCKIRCNPSTQKFLLLQNVQLDTDKIEWILID